jgi:hypothetical protein
MQRLNFVLQQQATKEAREIGQAVAAQQGNILAYRSQFENQKTELEKSISGFQAHIEARVTNGYYSSPEGRKQLREEMHYLEMAEAFHDDHFDDRHLAKATEIYNGNVARILDSDDPMSLANLSVDPMNLPRAEAKRSGGRTAPPGSIPPEKMFEMKVYGGYPKDGVVFNSEANYGMPEGYSPRLADPATVLRAIDNDNYLRMGLSESAKQELIRKNQQITYEALDKLQPMKDVWDNFNSTFNSLAPNAVQEALEDFLADDNPHKFDDPGRSLTSLSIQHMFGGGSKGEQAALLANEIFDGKYEPKTAEEMTIVMAMEAATFNINHHFTSEFMNAGDEKGSVATQLVKQIRDEMGDEAAALAMGVPNTGVGFVKAQDAMQQRLGEALSFSHRMNKGMWQLSALKQFLGDLRTHTRLADLYAIQDLQTKEGQGQRVMNLLGQAEATSAAETAIEGMSPEEAAVANQNQDYAKIKGDINLLGSMVSLSDELGPDVLKGVSDLISGGIESQSGTTPNLQGYLDQVRVDEQRSGYIGAAVKRAGFDFTRQANAKKAAQSFKEGGVPQVVAEQLPPLISTGARNLRGAMTEVGAPMVEAAAGSQKASEFRAGMDVVKGRLPLPAGDEIRQMGNLTPREKRQVVEESNRGF